MNVEAIWLRTDMAPGHDATPVENRPQLLRVLVKLTGDPNWRVAIEYEVSNTGSEISHITEGHALATRKTDPVTAGGDLR